MEKKKKRWPFALILCVIGLTLYNILPTVFFYTKPLSAPIGQERALKVGEQSLERVAQLENDSIDWLKSFNKNLGIKANSVKVLKKNPQIISLSFPSEKEASIFKNHLPRAGSLISFYPSQLTLGENNSTNVMSGEVVQGDELSSNVVYVQRKIPIRFQPEDAKSIFKFGEMYDTEGSPTAEYSRVIENRLLEIMHSAASTSENATLLSLALKGGEHPRAQEFLYQLAQNVHQINALFSNDPKVAHSFYATLTQGPDLQSGTEIDACINAMGSLKDRVQKEKIELEEKLNKSSEAGLTPNEEEKAHLEFLKGKENRLLSAISILNKNKASASSGKTPLNFEELQTKITQDKLKAGSKAFSIDLASYNPILSTLSVDYAEKKIAMELNPAISKLLTKWEQKDGYSQKRDHLNQLIFDEVAKVSREADELFTPVKGAYTLEMSTMANAQSFMTFDLAAIAKSQVSHIKRVLQDSWEPTHTDLERENYPITDWAQFSKLPASQKHLKLVVYSPNLMSKYPMPGFKNNSIYVVAKDLGKIIKKHHASKQQHNQQALQSDIEALESLLKKNGFMGYSGATYPFPAEFANDYIFEAPDFYLPILQATRENFTVHGTKKFALLEFSDVKQRILSLNRIETAQHEDLLKWRDEHNAALVDPTLHARFDVPAPTQNILWSNIKLSWNKYFRGDERKILHWGLDLDGGKTVQVALKDTNGNFVTQEADLNQGINELYNRVNKMGVSDVNIRQEGSYITLDFPGSNNLSATDLVKASSMTFHFVNEKFSLLNETLGNEVNKFLQEIWNEAVVTNKKDADSINVIAWNHLYGDSVDSNAAEPRSEAAKILFANGLRLQNPDSPNMEVTFNDQVSKIAVQRGESFAEWGGNANPLMVVFNNYALEGANLENIYGGYDPTQGNYLSFDIASSGMLPGGEKFSPRNTLYNWTKVFSKETLMGSEYESVTKGRGWRMAVILNGHVISAPAMQGPLKSHGQITGHFTQREINRLVSDLKAGSLSFTPQIVSETTVSPDLGKQERTQGILAAALALLCVIAIMIAYYHFAGIVASIAVLFNLLIMWATLQNIGASITLPMIAGAILTIGMAVDANVLVFERIREEFKIHGKLAMAISAGYKKAFSAIVDSNVTTIIAALILLHFDSGPIKGFAVTLIIGIVSSMFTALFMTKVFFGKWVQNPKHTKLSMANLIRESRFNFLRYGKFALVLSAAIILIGGVCLGKQRNTIFGMDFTGGFAVTMEVEGKGDQRSAVQKALLNSGVSFQDMQIRELGSSNHLRLFLSKALELPGNPFHGLPAEELIDSSQYPYESNPRLVWLVDSLKSSGMQLSEKTLLTLDQNFKSISGQMSDVMRNNAVIGLCIALAAILLYITLRFEFTYAVSATLGLAFDVMLSLGLLAILQLIGVPLQIDLNTVAALMTIVGYSLNDTIIVFDRIREDVKSMKRHSFGEVINHALNVTLSRTVMTSLTTLIVLVSLVVFGGSSIFGFSLIMAIGVVVGTLSTFFIATTLLLMLQRKTDVVDQKKIQLNGA